MKPLMDKKASCPVAGFFLNTTNGNNNNAKETWPLCAAASRAKWS